MRIQTKIETYCEILSFFIIKLIADDHTSKCRRLLSEHFGVCDRWFLETSMMSIWPTLTFSPITVGFILFHELLRCWLRGSIIGHLSFVILPVPRYMPNLHFFLPCATFSSQPSLNVNSLCFHMIKGTAPNLVLDKVCNIYFPVVLFRTYWSFEFVIWQKVSLTTKRCRYCFLGAVILKTL